MTSRDCHISGAPAPATLDEVIAARLGPVGLAFNNFVLAVANNPPNRIVGNIDATDEHLRRLMTDVNTYLSALGAITKCPPGIAEGLNDNRFGVKS